MLSHVAKLGATAIAVTALAVGGAVSHAGAASPTTPSPGCADVPLTAPTHLTGAPGNKYAVVSWFPSQYHVPDGCVQGYVVTPSEGKAVIVVGSGTTTKVKGLTNGNTDLFSVTSFNGSTFSPPAGILITIGVPTTPASVVAHHVGRGVVKVAFAPSDGNGDPVSRYTAVCNSANGGTTRQWVAKKSPITVAGLTHGKSYSCEVRASNDRGDSAFGRASVTKA